MSEERGEGTKDEREFTDETHHKTMDETLAHAKARDESLKKSGGICRTVDEVPLAVDARCFGVNHWYPILAPAVAPEDGEPCECGETVFDLAAASRCCIPRAVFVDERSQPRAVALTDVLNRLDEIDRKLDLIYTHIVASSSSGSTLRP